MKTMPIIYKINRRFKIFSKTKKSSGLPDFPTFGLIFEE
jgi:hypothetical protein